MSEENLIFCQHGNSGDDGCAGCIQSKLTKLQDAVEGFKNITHSECEDSWYSCPKSEDGCSNDQYSKNECTCGADYWNQKIESALKESREVE